MLSVSSIEYNESGIGNLEEAVAVAKEHGISNAEGAIHPDVLSSLYSLGTLIRLGLTKEIPGLLAPPFKGLDIPVYAVVTGEVPPLLATTLEDIETSVATAGGPSLPHWRPTRQATTGVRMITLMGDRLIREHTDDYEGLVASAQLVVDGDKIMHTEAGGSMHDIPVKSGDITLFACDTFSDQSRRPHSFNFTGSLAIAFTLGQDPFYTISGRYPFIEEHPEYFR